MSAAAVGTAVASQLSDTAKNTLVFAAIGVGAFAIWKVVDTINDTAEVLNIKDSKEEKKAKKVVASFEKTNDFKLAFTPNIWKGKLSNVITISAAEAIKRAKVLNDAFGGLLNDKEEQIYGVYRTTPSKASMVKIAAAYWVTYKSDLYQELKSRLDSVEMQEVIKIINSKKDFTPKR